MGRRLSSLARVATAMVLAWSGLVGTAQALVSTTVDPVTGAPGIQGFVPADSLVVNPNGVGHILLMPYFTVNGGNDTYLSITNTDTRNGKAVKLRFRGASNSDDIFDATLFLSPGDMWTAAVTKDAASGLSKLLTMDKSCTLPATVGKGSGTLFLTDRLPGNGPAGTNEGYVEILTMADIPPTYFVNTIPSATPNALYTATKHVQGVAPCTASVFSALSPAGSPALSFSTVTTALSVYTAVEKLGLTNPTTGLRGSWTIIHVPNSSAHSGAAVAIEARTKDADTGIAPSYGNIVFYPQTANEVPLADVRRATADPLLRGGVLDMDTGSAVGAPGEPAVKAAMYDFPDLSTPYLPLAVKFAAQGVAARYQAAALAGALSGQAISNDYVLDPALLARTDWVLSMPGRRYNVARDYEGAGSTVFTNLARDDADQNTGVLNFFSTANTTTLAQYPDAVCATGISGAGGTLGELLPQHNSGQTADREETLLQASSDFVVSPGEAGATFAICGETAVLSFAAAGQASVLGASLSRFDVATPFTSGWARIATPGLNFRGLPIIGFSAMRLRNNNATPGSIGNYGLTFPHTKSTYSGPS